MWFIVSFKYETNLTILVRLCEKISLIIYWKMVRFQIAIFSSSKYVKKIYLIVQVSYGEILSLSLYLLFSIFPVSILWYRSKYIIRTKTIDENDWTNTDFYSTFIQILLDHEGIQISLTLSWWYLFIFEKCSFKR